MTRFSWLPFLRRWTKPIDPRHRLGRRGERLAEKHLKQTSGFTTIKRNLRLKGGEIDLVMEAPPSGKGGDRTIVFVEVKTRTDGHPEYALTPNKKRRLVRLVYQAARRYGWTNRAMRIDVVTIVWPTDGKPEIRHHPNAVTLDDVR